MTKKVLIIGTEQSKCHEDIELSNCLAKKYLKDFLGKAKFIGTTDIYDHGTVILSSFITA